MIQTNRVSFISFAKQALLLVLLSIMGQVSWAQGNDASIRLLDLLKTVESAYAVSFLYEGEILENYQVSPKDFNPDKTLPWNLEKILSSTDLLYLPLGSAAYVLRRKETHAIIYGTVTDQQQRPLPGATIQVAKATAGAVTAVDGKYALTIKPGKWKLNSRYVAKVHLEEIVEIGPGDSLLLNFQLQNYPALEEIVVVGSRISVNSLLEIASPASVLNVAEKEMEKSFYGVAEFLQYNVPSFHSTQQTIADGTDHLDPATLKGLGPDQLLVLINGKRRHQSALVNINGSVGRGSVATDLNAIPIAAIEKIEVLRDGASVHYGSDAIAGVINIVLKENTNFTDLSVKSGLTLARDGFTTNVSANTGFQLTRNGGFLHLSMDYLLRDAVNRSGNYTGPIFGDQRDEHPASRDSFFDQLEFGNQRVMSVGNAAISNASIFFNAKVPIRNKLQLYGFGGYSYRFGTSSGFYRFPYQETKQSGIYPLGFAPKLKTNINDQSLTIGISEQRADWKVDISNTTGQNTILFNVLNSNNASLGLLSPNTAKAGSFKYLQNVTNLDLNKLFDKSIPIYLGLGAEFRLENFKQIKGEEESWKNYRETTSSGILREGGIQMFPGFRPENSIDQYRYNVGAYVNAEIELFKTLRLGGASRFEFYNDFGKNLSWKSYARYSLSPKTVIKGSVNTGFRAPSLPQAYYNSHSYQYISLDKSGEGVLVATFNNESPVTYQFGIEPLKAEKSTNANLGFASRITGQLSLSMDAYLIRIKDRIVISGRFSAQDAPIFSEILDPLGVSYAQFFTNAIDTETKGLDIELHYSFPLHQSKIGIDLLGSLSKTKIMTDRQGNRIIRTSELLAGFEEVLFNREEIGRIESAQPSTKWIIRLSHEYKKWNSVLSFTYFGAVNYIHPNDGDPTNWVRNEYSGQIESRDQIFTSKWITDLKIAYRLSNRLSFSLGGANIFNIYPDEHHHSANTNSGIFKYSRRVQQFGVRGAYWYLTAGLRL